MQSKNSVVWIFGLLAAAVIWVSALFQSHWFSRFDTYVFDRYQISKPRQWANNDITIVDLDEASIKELGQWPWPRTTLAEMTNRLGEMGAAAIVFDIVFSEPDRTSPIKAIEGLKQAGVDITLPSKQDIFDNDKVLAKAFSENTVVTSLVLSNSVTSDAPKPKAGTGISGTLPKDFMRGNGKAIRNLEILDNAASGTGDINISTFGQDDTTVRKTSLLQGSGGEIYPSLAMETLRVVQGAGSFKIKTSDGSGEVDIGERIIVSAQVGMFEIPTDADGALTVYHSPSTSKTAIPAHVILSPGSETKPEIVSKIANHIVLVGTSAAGLLDLRATPLEPVVAGVSIHAEIIDQIISGTYLVRPNLAAGIELTTAILAVLLMLFVMSRVSSGAIPVFVAILVGGLIITYWYLFADSRLLFSPVVPVLSVVAAYGAATAANLLITEKEGRFVRDAFTRYLSPAMVKQLSDDPASLQLGGEDKELTLLFCDIRGFTSLSEGLEPTQLTDLLNNFLTPMTTALLKRGATIDKYMGDAIMAFWNAPLDQADHAQRACHGILDMRRELINLNETSDHMIQIGIGLNTGLCCVGNLGSIQRFNYSAIGDAVNVASRAEGLTKQYGLDNLVAEETLSATTGFAAIEVDRVAVVGRSEALTVCTLMGDEVVKHSPAFDALNSAHDEMLDAYRAGDSETGLVAMTKATRLAQQFDGQSLNKVYAIYASRFNDMRENGVPENWDGVFRATSK